MTNNEILNAVQSEGCFGAVPIEQRKTWEGKAFAYLADVTLTANVAAYRGFVTGDNPIHLKSLEIVTEDADVTIEVSEDATYTDGTEVAPIARNRKVELTDYRDDFATMAFETATALKHQPHVGSPTIRRVMNNGNILHPDIAVAIDHTIDSDVYGIKVNPVAQVDSSQGLQIAYKSKQVRTKYIQETIAAEAYTADTLKILGTQSYDESKPVVKAVYNNTNVLLTPTSDYTISKDESNDWGITVLSDGEADDSKNIVVCYEVLEEYNADFTQSVPAFDFHFATLAIGTPVGTFQVGEVVIGETSEATGILKKIESGFMYLSSVEGEFADNETVTGDDSEATVTLTADPVAWFFVEFENQSHDDSAITVATVANGVRGAVVEYLSFTQDYTFALDTTYKITLKETAKTSATKPVTVLYQVEDLISKGDGLKIYTSPTVTDQGTVIEKYYLPGSTGVGTSRLSPGIGDDWELILRPNAKYLIKAISSVAQDILIKYRWYLEN